MKLWFVTGPSVAVLLLSSGATADQTSARLGSDASNTTISDNAQAANAIDQIAAVTGEVAQIAATAVLAASSAASTAETKSPLPTETPPPTAQAAAEISRNTPPRPAKDKIATRPDKQSDRAKHHDRLASAAAVVRVVGQSQTGSAAWYGGRYVGRRTTSGATLDTVHATAAHRSLPLNSLARVTNLRNGRSVIVRVTDRGPVDSSLLIDMSPRAADMLQMKEAGVVPVRVEQVVELPPDLK